jgi:hypothetical protein
VKFRTLIEVGSVFLLAAASLPAQTGTTAKVNGKTGAVPRAADGHPDLTGIWSNATRTPFERPAAFAGKPTISDEEARQWEARENQRWEEGSDIDGGRPVTIQGGAYNVLFYDNGNELARIGGKKRTSMVVDPPDGKVPAMLPEARARFAARRRTDGFLSVKDLPSDARCLTGNTPSVPLVPALYNNNIQITQSPDSILFEVEMVHDARIVNMNSEHVDPKIRKWFGHSIGRWEGDTLVVETTNFDDHTHYRGATANLKVTERFTRVSEKTIEYRATLDDPATWAKPWSIELAFTAVPGPLYEYACHEGNYAILGILGAK